MKMKIIYTAVTLFLVTILKAQDSGELIIPLSNPSDKGSLSVDIKRGYIKVVGTSRKDVLVKYKALESQRDYDDNDNNSNGLKRISAGSIDLEASESDNRVIIDSDSWNKGVNLEIEVPQSFDIEAGGYNGGDIIVENVSGEVVIENYNGAITAKGISGSITANTYNGKITVELLKVTPNVPMSFNTYNGDVDVTFPSGTKGSFKLKTSRGEIFSGFDMQLSKSDPVKKTDNKSGTYKVYLDDWVRGNINGGGPEIIMKTYNDNIYIRKR